ncbi:MAG: histone deacetylase [Chloroflexi bacterium]|nr:histone deacetylase [Chloroflexota bacterium]
MTVGFVTNPNHAGHDVEGHPEGPQRLEAVLALLDECGLRNRLERIEPRDATDEELAWVHSPEFTDALRRTCADGGGWADPDTYLLPGSYAAALTAAGSTIAATDAVLSGRVDSAFCAVRPPGHHARPDQAMGFCLLNNIALAARAAQRRHGLERVAIVDIDVHHGNGTQDAFYDDPEVLYCSTHQYPFYPGTGQADEIGAGEAEGTNVNIALPAGCGDAEYRLAFQQVVEPVVRRFRPGLILVSCGFDAHYADPIGGMALSVDGYGELAQRLQALANDLCDGRLVFVLEGGYDHTAVGWGVRRILELLLGEEPAPDPQGPLGEGRTVNVEPVLAELGRRLDIP